MPFSDAQEEAMLAEEIQSGKVETNVNAPPPVFRAELEVNPTPEEIKAGPDNYFTKRIMSDSTDLVKAVGLGFGKGFDETAKTIDMTRAWYGDTSWEELHEKYKPNEMQKAREAQLNAVEAKWDAYGPQAKFFYQVPRVISEVTPFIGATEIGGRAGGVGVGAMAAAGAAMVSGPAAPITAPAAFIAGYPVGYIAGVTNTAMQLSGAAQYNHLREQGYSHEASQMPALGTGIFEGLIYNLKLREFSKIYGKATEKAWLTPATWNVITKTMSNWLPQIAMTATKFGGLGAVSEAARTFSEWVAEVHQEGPAHVPTQDEIKKAGESFAKKWEEMGPRMLQGAVSGAQTGVGFGAAARVGPQLQASVSRSARWVSPRIDQAVKGVIDQVYVNREMKRTKLRDAAIKKGIVREVVYSTKTSAQLDQEVRDWNTVGKPARDAQTQRNVDAVKDATLGPTLKGNRKLSDLPPVIKSLVSQYRTGMQQGIFPVSGESSKANIGLSVTATSPSTALNATMLQFADSAHPAREVLDLTSVDLCKRVNIDSMRREWTEHLTEGGDMALLDALSKMDGRTPLAGKVLKEFEANVNKRNPLTSQPSTAHNDATREALKATDDVRAKLHCQFFNPILENGLRAAGYTFRGDRNVLPGLSTQEYVQRSLTPEQLRITKGAMRFYQKAHARADEGWVADQGERLFNDPFYSGIAERKNGLTIDPDTPFSTAKELFTSFTIDKTNNHNPIKLGMGLHESGQHYIDITEHYFAWAPKTRELLTLSNDVEFMQGLKDNFHKGFAEDVQRYWDLQVGIAKGAPSKGLEEFLGNFGTMVMSGNVYQMPKQFISGYMGYLAYVPNASMVRANTKMMVPGNKDLAAFLKDSKSKYIRRQGFSQELYTAMKVKDPGELLDLDPETTFTKLWSSPTAMGDDMHTTVGGYALYDHMKTQLTQSRNPKTKAERDLIHQESVMFADKIIEQHQSSSLTSQKTLLELEKGWNKVPLVLSKQNIQLNNKVRGDLANLLNRPEPKTFNQFVKTAVAVKASQLSFRQVTGAAAVATTLLVGGKVEDALYTMASQGVRDLFFPDTSMPVWGQVTNSLMARTSNWIIKTIPQREGHEGAEQVWAPSAAMFDVLESSVGLLGKGLDLLSLEENETTEDVGIDAIQFMQAWNRSIAFFTPKWLGGGFNMNPMLNPIAQAAKAQRDRNKQ